MNICSIGAPEGGEREREREGEGEGERERERERRPKKIFEEVIAENFLTWEGK